MSCERELTRVWSPWKEAAWPNPFVAGSCSNQRYQNTVATHIE
jgi:hypothetical protein